MKSLFKQDGGTYTRQGDYLLPNIKLPEKEYGEIGVWGQRRRQFLKQHHRVKYYNLLTAGELYPHLADTEQQAQEMFFRLVKELAEQEEVTEQLKAADMMVWIGKMNNIQNRAAEIVNNELIYC